MTNEIGGSLRVGVSLVKQLSDTLYNHKFMVIEELIANAYDAWATEVSVTVSHEEIVVQDNGEAMTPEELTRFFYISHTEKTRQKIKVKGKLERKLLGKFGIAKLSIYQVAEAFEITSWKNGVEAHAEFNFKDLEKKQFIDELTLEVESKPAPNHSIGTKIRLFNLRKEKEITASDLQRHVPQRLALGPQFTIRVNGKICATTEHLPAKLIYTIDEEIEEVGKIKGEIRYLIKTLPDDRSGVYVKVLGRVVNHNPRIIDLNNLTSPQSLARRTFGILEVDSLNNAIQAIRGGFIEDDPKYRKFLEWLSRKLNGLNKKALPYFTDEVRRKEAARLPGVLAQRLQPRMELRENASTHERGFSAKRTESKKQKEGREIREDNTTSFLIGGKRAVIVLAPLGSENSEAVYEQEQRRVVINSDHPIYQEASKKRCLEYHGFKAAAVALAAALSRGNKEFLEYYDLIIRGKGDEIA